MQFHQIKKEKGTTTVKRVGRGGKRGKTSGRGTKGQKARAGHRMRPEMRDIIKKLPKRRGYGKHRAESVDGTKKPQVIVNLVSIEKHYAVGETVNPQTLLEKGLIRRRGGKMPSVKILGAGALVKKVAFEGVMVSKSVGERTK
jgi:large subunit ribosomal protein L15